MTWLLSWLRNAVEKKSVQKNRAIEFDLLRSVAIIAIVLDHVGDYTAITVLKTADRHLVLIGLSLFVFISGYLTALNSTISDSRDMLLFARKRLMRIYPLYLPALAAFVALYWRKQLAERVWDLAIHLGCLQVLLGGHVVQLPTLWFVGLIAMYYVVYVLIAPFARSFYALIAYGILALVIMALVSAVLKIVDSRFFLYYPIFMGGVLLQRAGGLNQRGAKAAAAVVCAVLAAVALFIASVSGPSAVLPADYGLATSFGGIAAQQAYIFCVVLLGLMLAAQLGAKIPRPGRLLVQQISASAFAVYLFHRPLFLVVSRFLERIVEAGPALTTAVYLLAVVPAVFIIAHGIRICEARVVRGFGTSFVYGNADRSAG